MYHMYEVSGVGANARQATAVWLMRLLRRSGSLQQAYVRVKMTDTGGADRITCRWCRTEPEQAGGGSLHPLALLFSHRSRRGTKSNPRQKTAIAVWASKQNKYSS